MLCEIFAGIVANSLGCLHGWNQELAFLAHDFGAYFEVDHTAYTHLELAFSWNRLTVERNAFRSFLLVEEGTLQLLGPFRIRRRGARGRRGYTFRKTRLNY